MGRAFISYLDDNNFKVDGIVNIVETNTAYVKFSTDRNTITIPIGRILKIKEGHDE